MSKLRIGELFAGYGGLGLAIEDVFDAELAWYAEYDAAPSKIMAHHWPDLTNYGDVTAVDWSAVPPVDIISGGSPCQDLSLAGARKGMADGTRSNLWESMREAIATIKPTYVVWENVRGALSATATSDSDMGQREGFLGERGGHLRALGRVLGDLADLGYDTQWRGLRAADVGAPHGRFRVFILATRRGAVADGHGGRVRRGAALASNGGGTGADTPTHGANDRPREPGAACRTGVGITPDASCIGGHQAIEHDGRSTPTHDGASVPDQSDRDVVRAGSKRGHDGKTRGARGRFAPLANTGSNEPERRRGAGDLERPSRAGEADGEERERLRETASDSGTGAIDWRQYAPAIRRWEAVRGTAPAPTELTAKGKHRLSAQFCEWLMGVPAGWITDVPDVSRNDQLKAAGNGVVPQQAAAALRDMLAHTERPAP